MYKVVYIDYQSGDKRYPNTINDGDNIFTYGFASLYARKFKKYNSDINVECWKADSRISRIYSKKIEDVHYILFPSLKFGKIGHYSHRLIKHLKKELNTGKKIIFNISSFRHLLFYSVALRLKDYPLVVQHHGESSAIHKTKINNGFKKLFYALQIPLEKLCFNNIDLLLVLDERIKEYLPKQNKKIKIEVSTTGVDEEIFYPIEKNEAKKMLGWDLNKKHILYVGRLNYTKHPDILIDIFMKFKEEGRKDIELVLAGNEKDDPLYKKAVESGAIMYPKILQTELYIYLSAADVYALPKYLRDHTFGGIGMLPVQSLLCETPVVGDSLSNFPQKDIDKIGILASNRESIQNAIIEILNIGEKYRNIREIALKHYSWEKISLNTKNEYDNLLKHYAQKSYS